MKVIISFCLMLLFIGSQAQNTGINKSNPLQPLDVNGNVNVDGKIMVSGVAGAPGQVLGTTSGGNMAWVNKSNYYNVRGFTQNGNFTVPAGVTSIMVEAWGAGGGGSAGGGGAAGMYILSLQTVTPGQDITITLGVGGNKATYPGAGDAGSLTSVSGSTPFINVSAAGGNGAFAGSGAYGIRYSTSGGNFIQYIGQNGDGNTVTYAQKNASTFVIVRKYGDGGASGPDYSVRCQGQIISTNENTGTALESSFVTIAPFPGGGGGGGINAAIGGSGMVNIWY